jgi:hypothetical protein
VATCYVEQRMCTWPLTAATAHPQTAIMCAAERSDTAWPCGRWTASNCLRSHRGAPDYAPGLHYHGNLPPKSVAVAGDAGQVAFSHCTRWHACRHVQTATTPAARTSQQHPSRTSTAPAVSVWTTQRAHNGPTMPSRNLLCGSSHIPLPEKLQGSIQMPTDQINHMHSANLTAGASQQHMLLHTAPAAPSCSTAALQSKG